MKPRTIARIAPFVLAAALAMAPPAHAGIHLGGGAAGEHSGDGAVVASLAWRGEQRYPWELMIGHIGKRAGSDVEESWFLAVSRRLYWRQWFASGGVAWVNVDNDILSGHGQFMTGVGRELGPVSLSLRHLSNASTNGRNRGETFLLVEYSF